MNDLIQVNNQISVRQKRADLSLMLRKVVIKLSRDEFEVVESLIMLWVNSKKCESLEEKALFVLIFVNLYKNKMMPQLFKATPKITMNLTIPEAFALDYFLMDTDLSHCPYEHALSERIMMEIDKQTV